MFSYQGSLFSAVCSSDSFNRYHIVSCLSNFFSSVQPRCLPPDDPGSHLLYSSVPGFRNKHPLCHQPSPSLQIFLFCSCPSATKLILPSSPLIVNVFLVFYLFHAIQTIIGFPGFKRNNCRIFLLLPSSFTCSR